MLTTTGTPTTGTVGPVAVRLIHPITACGVSAGVTGGVGSIPGSYYAADAPVSAVRAAVVNPESLVHNDYEPDAFLPPATD